MPIPLLCGLLLYSIGLPVRVLAQAEEEGCCLGMDLLSLQRQWDDSIDRKLPWMWDPKMYVLRRPQTDPVMRTDFAPDPKSADLPPRREQTHQHPDKLPVCYLPHSQMEITRHLLGFSASRDIPESAGGCANSEFFAQSCHYHHLHFSPTVRRGETFTWTSIEGFFSQKLNGIYLYCIIL